MDFFGALEQVLVVLRDFIQSGIEQGRKVPLINDLIDERLYESFLQDQSFAFEDYLGQGAKEDCFQIKNIPLQTTLYCQNLNQKIMEDEQSEQICRKVYQNEKQFAQRQFKQIRNEFSWVGVNISSQEDNIEQLMKDGKQSLADLKLIIKMTSRQAFILQIIYELNRQRAQNHEEFIIAQEAFMKYIYFLIQAFQKQSQIRSASLSKEQQGDYLRKFFNNEEFQQVCKILDISIPKERADQQKQEISKSQMEEQDPYQDPSEE